LAMAPEGCAIRIRAHAGSCLSIIPVEAGFRWWEEVGPPAEVLLFVRSRCWVVVWVLVVVH